MARWIDPQPVHIPDALRALAAEATAHAALDALVAALLVRRGLADPAAARSFLDPAAYQPAPTEDLPDLEVVVDRLAGAIARGDRIAVWGDFDVDGQTATALYVEALRVLGGEVVSAIPSRHASHGLHPVGVQRLIDEGASLIVTADTGVEGHRAVDLAAAHGVEVLITDHHDLPEALPDARAVLNPKRLPAGHPLSGLPGVGVAYQVARALFARVGRDPASLLDLVALGIVADVAPLRDDVRYLLQRGLQVLRRTERVGLRALIEVARLDPERIGADDIGYALAPRLNALSRMGQDLDAQAGVELLTTDDLTVARTIATRLEALNAQRRWITRQVTESALAQLARDRALLDGPAIVVAGAGWDPGIVGIVAGRLAERYAKPAIVISAPEGELARGSARSVEGVDIHAAIAAQRALLHRCGGHPMAAGLSIDAEQIDAFRRGLWRTLAGMPPPPEPTLQIDAILPLDQLSLSTYEAVQVLAPFGAGNPAPVFVTRDLELVSSAVVGRTREHRRVTVRDRQGHTTEVMWWQSVDLALPEGRFDLTYTLGVNAFRGNRALQLTWVEARSLPSGGAIAEPVAEPAAATMRDCREVGDPVAALRALWAGAARGQVVVWGEGGTPAGGVPCVGRTDLRKAETLVVWTAPPGPAVLQAALAQVSPREVVLCAQDPGLDALGPFLQRLAGLVKHALRVRAGQVSLAALAEAMAHQEATVALGLAWLAHKGQLCYTLADQGRVTLAAGDAAQYDRWGAVGAGSKPAPTIASPSGGQPPSGEDLAAVQAQLAAALEETAAYRAYYRRAETRYVVR
ncbi:MAG: single-stranded-DNA-specific exonuclease RecJ [Anaerolineae bacterium]|nr:single-stranded-DNA-specific exonuclease RecJ [Anaerolineae bacterium]